ncbi:sigma-54-dependent transcriptional regulator [Enhygromyxa salina]|uniref:Nitrogen regulation protein n=1 Tax=Enhygromyxa salina TaxID=215803 RepID=A0A2S9Y8A2_9BACT|nr:sigma-54 dependent transcriptional regulator [Enhygromyxa salina]PRQ01333.1 Nitrogen regulation protein [Enhygromyxa salina]
MNQPNSSEEAPVFTGTVLVVDDEKNIRRTLRMVIEGEGATVHEAETGERALELLEAALAADAADPMLASELPNVVIMDVMLGGISGIEVLERLSALGEDGHPPLPVIMISGHASVADAVRATRLGAFDFFEKPLSRDRVVVSVRNALRQSKAERELRDLRQRVHGEIIGTAEPMRELMRMVSKVGRTKARVLITGESGTGKELIARAIHEASDRHDHAFVKVNCAAIPRELIESELFGHERGAFTGAVGQKKGLFEVAHRGTLFLDEIGDMDLDAQAKVLRVLQSGELTRVGGHTPIQVDVRVLAATHRNLQEMAGAGEFREDLFFRLAVVPIRMPPLRERLDDVPLLVRHFIDQACEENGLARREIDPQGLAALARHDWPGNVRELRNVIERMVVLSDGDLDIHDVPPELRSDESADDGTGDGIGDQLGGALATGDERFAELLRGQSELPLKAFREAVERAFILQRLRDNEWNVSRTAELLGIERTHLHRKLKILGIQRGER